MKLRQRIRRISSRSWTGWPAEAYAQARYRQRLLAVQTHLVDSLNVAPSGPLRLISMCAGDGRDVIGVLRTHPRRADVSAWLVELDRQSVAAGVREAAIAGLQHIAHFLNADATDYATYHAIAPADIVLVCGVWGHVPADERASLAQSVAAMCKPRGMAIWTRGVSKGRGRLQEIESLFACPVWERVRVSITLDKKWAVATHRYCGPLLTLPAAGRIFHFQRRAGK